MTPAPHHGKIDAHTPPRHQHNNNVHIIGADFFHGLLLQHPCQRPHLVAQDRRLFKGQTFRGRQHPLLDVSHDLTGLAIKKTHGPLNVGLIIVQADLAYARRRAAPDLVQQARPRAVGIHCILAGAQTKDLLQYLDGFTHGPAVRVRTKKTPFARCAASVIGDARRIMRTDFQIRVRLVIAEQDVIPGPQALDQVVFQQQGLGLGARDGDLDALDPRHHMGNARAGQIFLEIRRHALFKVTCLADIQHLIVFIDVPINAGQIGQVSQK